MFQSFPKIPRLLKPVVVTEKIDGTNGAVVIVPEEATPNTADGINVAGHWVSAQSRKRLIPLKPRGMDDIGWQKRDNAGFGEWVRLNAEALVEVLGPGRHFGEWWGYGIQRGYDRGKGDRRFSLFNTARWGQFAYAESMPNIAGLGVVPVLYEGEFDTNIIGSVFDDLMAWGSAAAPGFNNPEGVVIYHSASNQLFKMTDNGDVHKAIREEAPRYRQRQTAADAGLEFIPRRFTVAVVEAPCDIAHSLEGRGVA